MSDSQIQSSSEQATLPAATLGLSSVPVEELIALLSGIGIDLLTQATVHERLSLGDAVRRVPGGVELLKRLDEFRPGIELPKDRLTSAAETLIDGLRNVGVLNRYWMRRDATQRARTNWRRAVRRHVERIIRGRRSMEEFGGLFNGFLRRQVSAGSGCAIPVSMWQTCSLAAWTNLAFAREATDIIHGTLRSRICRSSRWRIAPKLHPNSIRLLIRLASPTGAHPRRMLHVLREHAGQCLQETHWARFWDQWVIAEALECRLWLVPRPVLLLPFVIEQAAARQALANDPDAEPPAVRLDEYEASSLTDPDWKADRPECLSTPWPPAVLDAESRRNSSSLTRLLQRRLHHVSRK